MKLEATQLTPAKYKEWNDFCLTSDDAWFWHTTDWIEFIVNREAELKTQNLSFLVYQGGQIKAVVPLATETYQSPGAVSAVKEFSFERWSIPSPAFANDLLRAVADRTGRDIVEEFVFKKIDELAIKHKVARVRLDQTPLAPLFLDRVMAFDYLMKFGYNNISLHTQLIDLQKPIGELQDNLRRNHRRNIKKASHFAVIFYTAKDITPAIFADYQAMHHKAAGRVTRSDRTFALMHDWIKRDLAFLAVVTLSGRPIGFEYYNIYKNNVYGNSAANDSDFSHLPIRHLLEWEAIKWMRQKGFLIYEIGLQQYGAQFYDFPDKKQLDISHFKKGFGGFTVPWFRGEKFYDDDFFLKITKQRTKDYAKSLKENS